MRIGYWIAICVILVVVTAVITNQIDRKNAEKMVAAKNKKAAETTVQTGGESTSTESTCTEAAVA